jgi:hypothetical protein
VHLPLSVYLSLYLSPSLHHDDDDSNDNDENLLFSIAQTQPDLATIIIITSTFTTFFWHSNGRLLRK